MHRRAARLPRQSGATAHRDAVDKAGKAAKVIRRRRAQLEGRKVLRVIVSKQVPERVQANAHRAWPVRAPTVGLPLALVRAGHQQMPPPSV